jgi:peptide/nickel transport system permease protein
MTSIEETTGRVVMRGRLRGRWTLPSGVSWYIIGIYVLLAIIGPWIVPHNPNALTTGPPLTGPSRQHWFGTDELGRDELSRVLVAVRVAVIVACASVGLALVVGGFFGIVSGYARGFADATIMRGMDIVFAFPFLVLAMLIAGLLGPSRQNAMIAIGIVYTPAFARVIRAAVLEVMGFPFIESARSLGAGDVRIMTRHVIPNIVAPLTVLTTVYFSQAILAESTLSFLGLGTQPPEAAWGNMLSNSQTYFYHSIWLVTLPGVLIFITVLSMNLFGNSLRDAFDPRLK